MSRYLTAASLVLIAAALVVSACAEAEIPIDETPVVIEIPRDTGLDALDDADEGEDVVDDVDVFDDDTDGGYSLIPDALGPPDVVEAPDVVEVPDVDPCPPTACTIGTVECVSPSRMRQCVAAVDGCGGWTVAQTCPDAGICENDACQKCVDNDDDGYGDGCLLGPDCDDDDPDVYPGAPQLCDGKDNNCNGETDDGFNVGEACFAGTGQCLREGQYICTADGTGTICDAVPGLPSQELCNGLDDNCDGTIDTGFDLGDACVVGIGECRREGVLICAADGSGTICDAVPGEPSEEVCDGRDNDCNGLVDDAPLCQTCVDDAYEPNNRNIEGTPLAQGQTLEMVLCPEDNSDWFRLGFHPAGTPIFVEILFDQALGDLDMALYVGGAHVATAFSNTSNETLNYTTVSDGNVDVHVYYKPSHTPRTAGTPYTIRR